MSAKPYVLYLGCTISARSSNYEISARRVAEMLGIGFKDIPSFGCCGYPLAPQDEMKALAMAATNLALAEKAGCNICALCSACTGMLTETAHRLNEQEDLRRKVNERLADAGLCYGGTVQVRHFARILYEEVGLEAIKSKVTHPLEDLRVAAHYGCHYLKPSEIHGGFDDVESPHTLDDLIECTGAKSVPYSQKLRCCGGGVLAIDEEVALKVTKGKLDAVREQEADAIVLICPFCSLMYDVNQKKIESSYNIEYQIPVLFVTQLLGLAFGIHPKELGLQMNRVKVKPLLQKVGAL